MWLCSNVGFISIVQDDARPNILKVRARKREHLETLFPGHEILELKHRDYGFRVIVDRPTVAKLLTDLILPGNDVVPGAVNYGNFKDSVRDHRLHDLYADFWSLHYRYQQEEPKTWPALKGGKGGKMRAKDAQRGAR